MDGRPGDHSEGRRVLEETDGSQGGPGEVRSSGKHSGDPTQACTLSDVEVYRRLYYNDSKAVATMLASGINVSDIVFEIQTDSLCACAEAFETLRECPADIGGDIPFSYGSTVSLEVLGMCAAASETDLTAPYDDYTIDELESLRQNSLENVICSYSRYSDDEDDTVSIDSSGSSSDGTEVSDCSYIEREQRDVTCDLTEVSDCSHTEREQRDVTCDHNEVTDCSQMGLEREQRDVAYCHNEVSDCSYIKHEQSDVTCDNKEADRAMPPTETQGDLTNERCRSPPVTMCDVARALTDARSREAENVSDSQEQHTSHGDAVQRSACSETYPVQRKNGEDVDRLDMKRSELNNREGYTDDRPLHGSIPEIIDREGCDNKALQGSVTSFPEASDEELNLRLSSLLIVGKKIGPDDDNRIRDDSQSPSKSLFHMSVNHTSTLSGFPLDGTDRDYDEDNESDLLELEWIKHGQCRHICSRLEYMHDLEESLPTDDKTQGITLGIDSRIGWNEGITAHTKSVRLTGLHIAAGLGHVETVKILLSHNCERNVVTMATENTPLHLAAMNNHPDVVDILLTIKSDANRVNSDGDTPLHISVDLNHKRCVCCFIKHGVTLNVLNPITQQTALTCAILRNNAELASVLLEAGGRSFGLEGDGTSGWTPLHQAACAGAQECLELLLENGADPNKANSDGETPLHLAASNGFAECVRSLIDAGAICKPANSWIVGDNQTPTMLAVYHNYPDVVRILLPHDDVTQVSEYGDTVLHYATYRGCLEVVESLLVGGADVNVKGHMGATPIWYAVPHRDVIQCLVRHKADVSVSSKGHDLDNMGTCVYKKAMTPLEVSLQEGYFESAEMLLRAGCTVKPQCWLLTGKTPRRFCEPEYLDVIKSLALLASGATTPLARLRRSRVKKSQQSTVADTLPSDKDVHMPRLPSIQS